MAIAGAGLGGLAFGLSLMRVCQENQVEPLPGIKIFERDASSEARVGQGYTLAIRGDSGGLQVQSASGMRWHREVNASLSSYLFNRTQKDRVWKHQICAAKKILSLSVDFRLSSAALPASAATAATWSAGWSPSVSGAGRGSKHCNLCLQDSWVLHGQSGTSLDKAVQLFT